MGSDIITRLDSIDYSKYEAVIFDCFGTILNIKTKTNPYFYLIKHNQNKDKKIYNYLMKKSLDEEELSTLFNIAIDSFIFNKFKYLLNIELNSIEVFSDAQKAIKNINTNKIIICSNLASPYGEYVKKMNLNCILSYEIGHIKPEHEIYNLCLEQLKTKPSNTLFVGDNYISDYLTPKKLGFNSLMLNR